MPGKVRVRGVGALTCHGAGLAPLVTALRTARSAGGPLTLFSLPFQNEFLVNEIDHTSFPPGEAGMTAMALAAITEALADAEIEPGHLHDAGLFVGTSNLLFAAEAQQRAYLADPARVPAPALRAPGFLSTALAQNLGVRGPVCAFSTACSSSANALLAAHAAIARGQIQRALVLGIEGLSAVALSGFHSLMLLDPEGCRVFDANRRGLQLGEGAAAILLEASGNGDAPGIWIAGGANRCDTHHMTSAQPDGKVMRDVMTEALSRANVLPTDIVAIKAHGTGSGDNDAAEASAMRALFGTAMPPFTALKRYIGHTLGACGALEVAALVGCLRSGFVPPAAGFAHTDPALGISPLTDALPAHRGAYLCNYFGFGGNYCALVLRHD